ncbi:RNA polymerase sigma factor [Dyadobacter sp. MSC1_007]|uniref:RNA polymerase sigma factor n=1 Tax=Dyadobacter sp. MSC1_007 TaxID=2909264 RepID=UPI00202EC43B|nr:RNA polymerase sigma-70 factor [Dyadobacter sp. MSC1_007]
MQKYSDCSDGELLSLLTESNRLAFKQLYISHYRSIFAYALKFTKSADLAEDITQDVFLKIWESRETLSEVRHFKSYLFATCKNMTLNVLARSSRETKIMEQVIYGAQKFNLDTENELQQQEYERLLQEAIEQLPPQRKLIFKLCKIEGKSYDEVAAQMGISAGTINDHIVKGTKSVREYLRRYNISLCHLVFFALLK